MTGGARETEIWKTASSTETRRRCWEAQTTGSVCISHSYLFTFKKQNRATARLDRGYDSREVPLCLLAATTLQSHDKTLSRYSREREPCMCVCMSACSYITTESDPGTRQLSPSCVLLSEAPASYV